MILMIAPGTAARRTAMTMALSIQLRLIERITANSIKEHGLMLPTDAWPLAAGLGIAGGLAVVTWALTRGARADRLVSGH